MFYSQTLLGPKGPLGTVWCAAHMKRPLKKSQYIATDIPETVGSSFLFYFAFFHPKFAFFLILFDPIQFVNSQVLTVMIILDMGIHQIDFESLISIIRKVTILCYSSGLYSHHLA